MQIFILYRAQYENNDLWHQLASYAQTSVAFNFRDNNSYFAFASFFIIINENECYISMMIHEKVLHGHHSTKVKSQLPKVCFQMSYKEFLADGSYFSPKL